MGPSAEESASSEQQQLLEGQRDVEPVAGTQPAVASADQADFATPPTHVERPAAACLPSTTPAVAGPSAAAGISKEALLCRICFEEDTAANLAQPCGCSGTQRFAHHDCIQRWVHEKGNLRCEVCEQDYKGAFVVPPPPPPPPVIASGEAIMHPLFGPMIIRVDDGTMASRAAAMELFDEQEQYQQQNPGASWCFTFIIFVMFLVVLHHTTQVTDGMDGSSDSSGGGMVVPADMGSGGTGQGMGGDGDDAFSTSMTLILLWFIAKVLLFGIPLYTVMKIAARQAQREQYEAMFGATAQVTEGPDGRMMLRVVRADAPRGPYAV